MRYRVPGYQSWAWIASCGRSRTGEASECVWEWKNAQSTPTLFVDLILDAHEMLWRSMRYVAVLASMFRAGKTFTGTAVTVGSDHTTAFVRELA